MSRKVIASVVFVLTLMLSGLTQADDTVKSNAPSIMTCPGRSPRRNHLLFRQGR